MELRSILICREMGWTFQEYREQPQWFITSLFSLLREETDEIKRRSKT